MNLWSMANKERQNQPYSKHQKRKENSIMSNYAIFRMGKLKSSKDMTDAYKHNERLYDVENADPSKMNDNVEYINTMGLSYEDLFEKTITDLKAQGVPNRTIRKDAVKGFEIILTFSREQTENIDIEKWAEDNMKWLDENFNPPNHEATFYDKETEGPKTIQVQNIKHAILHMDESKPHIHAFIVPIDDKGNLNSHYYNSGRYNLKQLQTEYAKAMEKHNLVRGEEHSVATPEQMTRYYNNIKKAVEAQLPEPLPGETIQEYKQRAEDVYQIALSNHRNEIVKKDQQIVHLQSAADKKVAQTIQNSRAEHDLIKELNNIIGNEEGIERTPQLVKMLTEYQAFTEAIANNPNDEIAQTAYGLFWEMIEKERERKEKEEKEKNSVER